MMLDQDVYPLYYNKGQRNQYLIACYLVLGCWIVSSTLFYFLTPSLRNFLIEEVVTTVVLTIILTQNLKRYHSILKDSIAYNEEAIIRYNITDTKVIRYEDIVSVKDSLFSNELIITDKKQSIRVPKHKLLFSDFYVNLERKLFNKWVPQTTTTGFTISQDKKEKIKRRIIGTFCIIAPLFFLEGAFSLLWIVFMPMIYHNYLEKRFHYRFEKEIITLSNFIGYKKFRVSKIHSIDLKRSLPFNKVIIEFQSGENTLVIDERDLTFPARTLFRFLKTRYGLKEKVRL